MKTLPYLKQLTYTVIVMAFPFIFSASKDSKAPKPVHVTKESAPATVYSADETIRTIRVTVDSLKHTGVVLTKLD
ncbi:MAG: hypothetical protein EOO88_09930 [Pedobacter sp.]|nr:MAG: hypothetical protein EOO88_09930 [Pedobacter sp.]